ncbi:MAG TPA: YeeE/YedE family protein [Acidiferrobacteraceae bacterium]|nr:YeeE/YedE family protein [Acidiferrobacteraceae bacterium]
MGAIVFKTNFCTMGAVSDWVNMGDTGRLRAWVFAMTVALAGVLLLEYLGKIELGTATFPPYRTANFAWLRYVLGGTLFGIGMTLGSGCAQRTLVRIGGGNIKSIVVLVIIAASAYMMLWGEDPLAPGEGIFTNYFMPWIQPTTVDLAAMGIGSQELGAIIGGAIGMEDTSMLHFVFGGLIALSLAIFVFVSTDFRSRFDNVLAGFVIGLVIIAGWYITAGPMGEEWKAYAEFADEIPSRVMAQSYTFVSPTGDTWRYLSSPTKVSFINFGVMALFGVIVGSFLYAIISKRFSIEWFASFGDFFRHAMGAVLMGVGGVLAMGCTVGQAITGISTLALGSILVFFSIVFGSALTMKIQYYRMVYEDEANFYAALVSSLVDMRMLPKAMRKLEAV